MEQTNKQSEIYKQLKSIYERAFELFKPFRGELNNINISRCAYFNSSLFSQLFNEFTGLMRTTRNLSSYEFKIKEEPFSPHLTTRTIVELYEGFKKFITDIESKNIIDINLMSRFITVCKSFKE